MCGKDKVLAKADISDINTGTTFKHVGGGVSFAA